MILWICLIFLEKTLSFYGDSNDFHDFLDSSEWSFWASPVSKNARSRKNGSLDFRQGQVQNRCKFKMILWIFVNVLKTLYIYNGYLDFT